MSNKTSKKVDVIPAFFYRLLLCGDEADHKRGLNMEPLPPKHASTLSNIQSTIIIDTSIPDQISPTLFGALSNTDLILVALFNKILLGMGDSFYVLLQGYSQGIIYQDYLKEYYLYLKSILENPAFTQECGSIQIVSYKRIDLSTLILKLVKIGLTSSKHHNYY